MGFPTCLRTHRPQQCYSETTSAETAGVCGGRFCVQRPGRSVRRRRRRQPRAGHCRSAGTPHPASPLCCPLILLCSLILPLSVSVLLFSCSLPASCLAAPLRASSAAALQPSNGMRVTHRTAAEEAQRTGRQRDLRPQPSNGMRVTLDARGYPQAGNRACWRRATSRPAA